MRFRGARVDHPNDSGARESQRGNNVLVGREDGGWVGDELREVWAVTVGLCDADQPLGRLDHGIDQLALKADAFPSRRAAEILHRHVDDALLNPDADDDETRCIAARLHALCDHVEREDKAFLRDLKLTLVRGLEVFERNEDATIDDGGKQLVKCLTSVVKLVDAFHARFASGLRELGIVDKNGNPLI